MTRAPATWPGWLAALWGLGGISLIIGSALWRLSAYAVEALSAPLQWYHWAALVPWVLFMAHSEGYRGFQKAFSPRVAARARWLRKHPGPCRSILAPLFCMGFFGATRKRQTVAYALTSGIIGLVLLVRLLPQPWRGIVDLGVVVGLGWGLIALWIFSAQALTRSHYKCDPELSPKLQAQGSEDACC